MDNSVKIALIIGAVAIACVWIYSTNMSPPEGVTVKDDRGRTLTIEKTKTAPSKVKILAPKTWTGPAKVIYDVGETILKIIGVIILLLIGAGILWAVTESARESNWAGQKKRDKNKKNLIKKPIKPTENDSRTYRVP